MASDRTIENFQHSITRTASPWCFGCCNHLHHSYFKALDYNCSGEPPTGKKITKNPMTQDKMVSQRSSSCWRLTVVMVFIGWFVAIAGIEPVVVTIGSDATNFGRFNCDSHCCCYCNWTYC